jgi:7-carboxy-7-deazaguanine synthase
MVESLKKYAYSEIFYSIQGEGKYTGVPTAWLRFFLCNLQCDGFGQKDPTDESTYELPYLDFDPKSVNRIEDLPVWKFGCDSSYSWSSKFKHLQMRKNAVEICDDIQASLSNEHNPTGVFRHPLSRQEQHMCFTGGEPLMKHGQDAIVAIMKEFKDRPGGPMVGMTTGTSFSKGSNQPEFITFETNGTQPLSDEFVSYFKNRGNFAGEVFFSISPKLFTVSGEKADKAIKPEVVKQYNDLSGAGQLKFVISADPRSWEEMDKVIAEFRAAGVEYPVYIMPVGATEEGQAGEYGSHASAGKVAEMAYQRGYNVSARVHVYLWGNLIGV